MREGLSQQICIIQLTAFTLWERNFISLHKSHERFIWLNNLLIILGAYNASSYKFH